ncbi:hypothetical protein J6590_028594 [Homalodisca vitripennis]|nr:hypothetical protein J6590_028594 [Homalodisca vitripennis]
MVLTPLGKFTATQSGVYDMPLTINDAADSGYVCAGHDDDLNCSVYSLPGDTRVCVLFDCYSVIAGLRICFIKADVGIRAASNNLSFPYNFDEKPQFVSHDYWNSPAWCFDVLFDCPETIKSGNRHYQEGVVADFIWLYIPTAPQGWTKIARDESGVLAQNFTKQGCYPGMGQHYFYEISPNHTTDCQDYQGFFVIFDKGELIGLGISPVCSFTNGDREWMEDAPFELIEIIVPYGPSCLDDWVTNYGITGFHMFLVHNASETTCPT